MPIYAYRCESCGHSKDVLQKMSDAPLTECPQCGAATFRKQLTAAGFQLKGSGWYVTDFRDKSTGAPAAPKPEGQDAAASSPAPEAAKPADAGAKAAPAPAATPAAAPAPSSGTD